MKAFRWGPLGGLFVLVATVSCTNTFFSGGEKDRPRPQGDDAKPQTAQPTAVSPSEVDAIEIPDDKKAQVTIKVVRLNSDSWWKNCVDAGILIREKPTTQGRVSLACNKGEGAVTEQTVVVHKEECNTLQLRFSTYENKGGTCAENPQAPCNGPYNSTPDQIRVTSKAEDRPFFLAFDARQVEQAVAEPGFAKLVAPKDKSAVTNAAAGTEPALWMRVFMEDQPPRNLQTFITRLTMEQLQQKAPLDMAALRENLGIDFDDYVLDVQVPAGVNLRIEGNNHHMGSAKPAHGATPPSTCQ